MAFILGIVAGSALAIFVCLAMVLVVFLLLRAEHPEFNEELPALLRFTALFAVYGAIGLVALIGQLRGKPWKGWAMAGLVAWSSIVVLATRYWLTGGR
ncbi:MAG: hypothetical protein ACRETU_03230 [Steroidobacterales bacterium]